ncbi:hypothetical protein BK374_24670 [Escherichia coli]|nr:hypothetical protein BK374_24670 [Escherichia coli]
MLNRKLNIRLRHSLNSHCIPSIIINNTVRSFQRSVMNIRNAEGQLRWRCWNFEPDAGKQLNSYLASEGILRQ